MLARICAGILLCFALRAQSCPGDQSNLANVINTAAGVSGNYAGYTFLTINGLNMPTVARAIPQIAPGGSLPTTMGGVTVLVNGLPAYLISFTPQQILALLPRTQTGCVTLFVSANSIIQFQAQIYLNATAPGLFTYADGQTVIASHSDWSLVNSAAPAQAGEWISLWASGLGLTNPNYNSSQAPASATELADKANFSVLLNGVTVDPSMIGYVGVAPGFAGLYQINLKLPPDTPASPEIRLRTADNISPPQRYLSVR